MTKAVVHLQQDIKVIEITLKPSVNLFVPGAEVTLWVVNSASSIEAATTKANGLIITSMILQGQKVPEWKHLELFLGPYRAI